MRVIPHDLKGAVATWRMLRSEVVRHGDRFASIAFGFGMPFALGAALSLALLPQGLTGDRLGLMTSLSVGLLAFVGILVGFLVTLMLFTGRFEVPADSTFEETKRYVARVSYLLYSQALTLVASILTAALALVWTFMLVTMETHGALLIVGSVLGGFASVAMIRAFMLPLQIFEMHRAWMDSVIRAKKDSTNARYRKGSGG